MSERIASRHRQKAPPDGPRAARGQGVGASAPREQAPRESAAAPGQASELIGESPEFLEICRLVAIVAREDTTVLIQGESGTGKDVIAETLHRYSRRADRPLVRVNCPTISETTVEGAESGPRGGAATGTIYTHKGRFELGDGVTLLLEEVGAMSLDAQAKLLRVLPEREFTPLSVDVRVIATTDADLEKATARGDFRKDLYYRLATVPISVPPLRARRRDILPLAEHFLARSGRALGRPAVRLGESARNALLEYGWPGNVRELKNAIEYAVLLAAGEEIGATNLPAAVCAGVPAEEAGKRKTLRERMMQHEREVLLEALEFARGVRKTTAEILGIDPRNLRYFLRKHGIE